MITMGVAALLELWTALAAATGTAPRRPSLAVLQLQAGTGVSATIAREVSDIMVSEARQTGRYSRVVGMSDIQAALAVEVDKQLTGCSTESCLAEIASAMDADWLVSGSLAELAGSQVFNARIFAVREGRLVAAVSERVPAGGEGVFLDMARPVMRKLTTQALGDDGTSPLSLLRAPNLPLLGAAVGMAGAAVVVGTLALPGLALGVGLPGLARLVPAPNPGVRYEVKLAGIYGTAAVASGLGLLMMVCSALVLMAAFITALTSALVRN